MSRDKAMEAAARAYYQREIDPNAEDPMMYKYMADFTIEQNQKLLARLRTAVEAAAKESFVSPLLHKADVLKLIDAEKGG